MPLAAAGIDRAAHRRRDTVWLDAAVSSESVRILLMRDGMPLVEGSAPAVGGGRTGSHFGGARPLLWLGPQAVGLASGAERVFLGMSARGSPLFALEFPASFSLAASPIAGLGVFEDFRAAAAALDAHEAGAAATSRALFEWHRRHRHCSVCGGISQSEEAGWKRRCASCAAEHFPRTDPVAIMLAVRGDKCLLGRQAAWRPGFWSCLAGFVEPGESFEQAAAREIFEEAGIVASTDSARYLFCQPWPFPSSLMIGLIIDAESEEIRIDATELEAARWFTREETTSMMAGTHAEFFSPPRLAIAHHVIQAWLERA